MHILKTTCDFAGANVKMLPHFTLMLPWHFNLNFFRLKKLKPKDIFFFRNKFYARVMLDCELFIDFCEDHLLPYLT